MLKVLGNPLFFKLFLAQVTGLLGTGIATVALALVAFDLSGGRAALVLGVLFTIKMVIYVTLAPMAGALAERIPRRRALVGLDLVRVGAAALLPFVGSLWQVYALMAVIYAASAGFTPLFQATIPDVLPDEGEYTRALSLSRLAYDTESILSPALAALALVLVAPSWLFLATAAGFAASALFVLSSVLPAGQSAAARRPFQQATTRGIRIYLATPRLRGLWALNLAGALVVSIVLVGTVVLVREDLGLGPRHVAIAMAAYGAGSMVMALLLPSMLDRIADRTAMLFGTCAVVASAAGLAASMAVAGANWLALLTAWVVVGAGYSAVLTPSGRLLRRSSHPDDRAAVFAAQFALSHAGWLVAYPLAGLMMDRFPAEAVLAVHGALALCMVGVAVRVWPVAGQRVVEHEHPDLPPDHPHLTEGRRHTHPFVIDDIHPRWPV